MIVPLFWLFLTGCARRCFAWIWTSFQSVTECRLAIWSMVKDPKAMLTLTRYKPVARRACTMSYGFTGDVNSTVLINSALYKYLRKSWYVVKASHNPRMSTAWRPHARMILDGHLGPKNRTMSVQRKSRKLDMPCFENRINIEDSSGGRNMTARSLCHVAFPPFVSCVRDEKLCQVSSEYWMSKEKKKVKEKRKVSKWAAFPLLDCDYYPYT